jgi:hypothetical protein
VSIHTVFHILKRRTEPSVLSDNFDVFRKDARNRALHIGCHCLHQIGQFVDDNDDVGNFVRNLDIAFWQPRR